MDVMEEAGAEWDWEHPKSRLSLWGKPHSMKTHLVFRAGVHIVVEKLMQEAIDKLDDRVINIAEQSVVDALEACDINYNKTFIENALRSVLNELALSFLNDSLLVRESFLHAIIQVTIAPKSLAIVASAAARDSAFMASIAWYAARL